MKRLLTILSGILLIISSLSSCVSNPENDEKIDEVIDKEEEKKEIFTVKRYGENREIIEVDDVKKGDIPEFNQENPTKDPDKVYKYIFNGWEPEIGPITKNTNYYPNFFKKNNDEVFTVKFLNYDGTVIQQYNEVLKNQFVFNYDTVPTRPSDSQYKYVFREWSPELHRIQEDTTYIATYDKIPLYENIEDSMVPIEDHGKLFIFGEAHGDKGILEEELKVWGNYYENYGFRDLFVEQDQVWATLYNIYMQTDGDDYLKHIFRWFEDGAGFSIYYFNFFKTIKEKYPETIFHGINSSDHYRWNVNIDYYLKALIKEGFLDEKMFQYTKDQILNNEKQVEVISSSLAKSDAIRDAGMAQSIMEERLRIGKKNVMCILGAGHTGKNIHIDEEHKDWYNAGTIIARNFGTSLYHDSDHCLHFETNEREVPPDELFQYNYPDYNEIYMGTLENLPYGINDYSMYDYVKFYLLEDAYEDMKNTPYDGLTTYSYNILPFKPEFNKIYKAVYYNSDNNPGLIEYYRSSPYYVSSFNGGRFLLGLSF